MQKRYVRLLPHTRKLHPNESSGLFQHSSPTHHSTGRCAIKPRIAGEFKRSNVRFLNSIQSGMGTLATVNKQSFV